MGDGTTKVGILTISDSASSASAASAGAGASLDRSGPVIHSMLSSAGYVSFSQAVCADDVVAIGSNVQRLAREEGCDVIITTGGTGFGKRDVTPEAIEPLVSRKTPALMQAITAASLTKTPLAALSRGISGIITVQASEQEAERDVLVVTLPGSPKAVSECMQVLLADGLLAHALELLDGGTGEIKHRQMQGSLHRSQVETDTDTGHAHCLHHHHRDHDRHRGHGHSGAGGLHSHQAPKPRTTAANHTGFRTIDPSSGPSLRHRTSPYPLIELDEALRLIALHTPPATAIETLPVDTNLIGHVLAEDVSAPSDLPPGPTTNVDGYAVLASATPKGEYNVVTLKTLQDRPLREGEIFRINTGQALPAGTDAVVMVEDTELISATPEGEEQVVGVLAQVDAGENVRPRGSDVKANQVVLHKGTTITALGGEIGTLAFLGRDQVQVYRKPTIAILSTGNELIDASASPSPSASAPGAAGEPWGFSVFDANRPGLAAAISGLGYRVIDLGIVSDDAELTLAKLQTGLREADVVVTTGGTSMGESDMLKPLLERSLAGHIHFGRVAMKPGKPTTFATVPVPVPAAHNNKTKIVFALPGNPASALVTFYVFVLPALRKLSGHQPGNDDDYYGLPKVNVKLASEMRLDSRAEFHRVTVQVDKQTGELVAYTTGKQRSSGMHSMAHANALVALPPFKGEPHQERVCKVDHIAKAILLGSIV